MLPFPKPNPKSSWLVTNNTTATAPNANQGPWSKLRSVLAGHVSYAGAASVDSAVIAHGQKL